MKARKPAGGISRAPFTLPHRDQAIGLGPLNAAPFADAVIAGLARVALGPADLRPDEALHVPAVYAGHEIKPLIAPTEFHLNAREVLDRGRAGDNRAGVPKGAHALERQRQRVSFGASAHRVAV